MKKLILIFLFIIFNYTILSAQFQISSTFKPVPGNIEKMRNVYGKSLSAGSSGENQKWDFTDIILLNDSMQTTFMNPTLTPYGNSFPSANLASVDLNKNNYTYYKISNEKFEVLGYGQSIGVLTYSKTQSLMQYPLSYLQSYSGEFAGSGSNMGYTLNVCGSYTTTCDAYGTISLPSGTSEVMRIKFVTISYDTLYYDDSPFSINCFVDTSYTWFKKDYKFSLFFLSYSFTEGKITKSAGYVINSATIDNSQLKTDSY